MPGLTHRRSPAGRAWRLATTLPYLAGAASWLLAGAIISSHECETGGSGGGVLELIVFCGLVGACPTAVAWFGRRTRPLRSLVPAIVLSLVLAAPLVLIGHLAWWFGHGCYD